MVAMRLSHIALALACVSAAARAEDLRGARDRQDRWALERAVREAAGAAQKQPKDAGAQYRLAESESYLAEVALELRDKDGAKTAAEAGIRAAERAVELQPAVAENHRILGTLCGQVIPAQLWLALRYGRCARASIDRAIQLDPKSSRAYLSRGVGNYYLPTWYGGGIELAIRDLRKAVELDPRSRRRPLVAGHRIAQGAPQRGGPQGDRQIARAESEPKLGQAAVEQDAGAVMPTQPRAATVARCAWIGGAIVALTLLTFFQFPGRTYLQSDTQIYLPILERLWDPAAFTRELLAQHPHVSFTIYDEVALGLRRLTGLDFETVLAPQQFLFRALGILGVFLLARSLRLSTRMALLVAATFSLGAAIAGPTVLTLEYEPVPRGFAMLLLLFAAGLAANGRDFAAGIAVSLGFLYHAPSVDPVLDRLLLPDAVALEAGGDEPADLGTRSDPGRRSGSAGALPPPGGRERAAGVPGPHRSRARAHPTPARPLLLGIAVGAGMDLALPAPVGGFARRILAGAAIRLPRRALLPHRPAAGGRPGDAGLLPAARQMEMDPDATDPARPGGALRRRYGGNPRRDRRGESRRAGRWWESALWFLLVFAIPVSTFAGRPLPGGLGWLALGLAMVATLAVWAESGRRKWAPLPWAAAVLVPFFLIPAWGVPAARTPENANLAALAAWARSSTPKDAVFLFPDAGREVYPGTFRARALRAVYVDWKSGGQVNFLRSFAREWWTRWQRVGAYPAGGIDYLVLKPAHRLDNRAPVFENPGFVVYRP